MTALKYDISDIVENDGEEIDFEGAVDFVRIDMGDRVVNMSEPVSVMGVFRNVGHGILVVGSYNTKVSLDCSRCLSKIDMELNGNFEELYVRDESKYDDANRDIFTFETNWIELSQAIYQVVVSEIPFKPLCQNECLGICQICGKNLNDEPHICQEQSNDIRMSKLQEYFKKSEEG